MRTLFTPQIPCSPRLGWPCAKSHILLCCNHSAGLAGPVCRTVMCSFKYLFSNDRHTRTGHKPTPHWPSTKVSHLTIWVLWKKWRWQKDEAPVWFALLQEPLPPQDSPCPCPQLGEVDQNRCHCGKLGTFKGLWYSHSSALCTSPPLRVCVSAHLFIAPHWQKKERHPLARGKCPN